MTKTGYAKCWSVTIQLLSLSMSDDKSKTGGQDRTRISLSEHYEVRGWANRFDVTPDELKAALKAFGTEASAVGMHLKGSKR